jgi:hypothetical protein
MTKAWMPYLGITIVLLLASTFGFSNQMVHPSDNTPPVAVAGQGGLSISFDQNNAPVYWLQQPDGSVIKATDQMMMSVLGDLIEKAKKVCSWRIIPDSVSVSAWGTVSASWDTKRLCGNS